MSKYRKKPIVIEATQWFRNGDHPLDNGTDTEGEVVRYYRRPGRDGELPCEKCGVRMHDHGWIDTLEGGHVVCPGDYVITGVQGERYPCKPEIFEETYDTASDVSDADRLAAIERGVRELADELKRTGEEGGLYEDPDEACACISIELRAILNPEGT